MTVDHCTMSSGLKDLMTESCEHGSVSPRLEKGEDKQQ